MRFSRRSFLRHAAAAAATAALPAAAAPPGTGPGSPAGFGFTLDGEVYETGFASRAAAAAAAALDHPGRAFSTAEVMPHALAYPDALGESAANFLLDGRNMGAAMAEWLAAANEELEYEGEIADAIHRSDRSGLGDAGRRALAAAVERAGDPDLASIVLTGTPIPDEIPDALLDAVEADAGLAGALDAALRAFASDLGLESEMRGLRVSAVEEHPVPSPAARAA